ncbi:MAG: hypothetical protein HGA45_27615 [Chloroflexales bacterium]|nr:hypothetical protein [Chloroflexales bacterium]
MTTILTPEQIAALPLPTNTQDIPAELLARLDSFCTGSFAGAGEFYAYDTPAAFLVGGLFGVFYGGKVDEARGAAAQEVLRHFGYVAENTPAWG